MSTLRRRLAGFGDLVARHGGEQAVPHAGVHRLTRRSLEAAQDVLVVGLVLVPFALMLRTLLRLLRDVFAPALDFRVVLAEVLFMLVMMELVRLLVVYLGEHHVAVDAMVELGIVSTLREIVLRGVVELTWQQVVALALFLHALGIVLQFGDLRLRLARATAVTDGGRNGAGPATPPRWEPVAVEQADDAGWARPRRS